MSKERDTDPSELRVSSIPPSIPRGATLVSEEVLHSILDELKSLRAAVHQSKTDILAQLADLTLEVIPRIQKIEEQAVTGFPVCKYHHSNGSASHP